MAKVLKLILNKVLNKLENNKIIYNPISKEALCKINPHLNMNNRKKSRKTRAS